MQIPSKFTFIIIYRQDVFTEFFLLFLLLTFEFVYQQLIKLFQFGDFSHKLYTNIPQISNVFTNTAMRKRIAAHFGNSMIYFCFFVKFMELI